MKREREAHRKRHRAPRVTGRINCRNNDMHNRYHCGGDKRVFKTFLAAIRKNSADTVGRNTITEIVEVRFCISSGDTDIHDTRMGWLTDEVHVQVEDLLPPLGAVVYHHPSRQVTPVAVARAASSGPNKSIYVSVRCRKSGGQRNQRNSRRDNGCSRGRQQQQQQQ